jgi:hypothetical protein
MDLNNIVGFKAVDKNGNERQVTVDEMTELVSARIVSAASEISTFAAAAAAGTDEFEDQLPQSDTFSWLRTLDGSKNPTLTSSSAAAKVLGGLLGINDSWFRFIFVLTVDSEEKSKSLTENGFYICVNESVSPYDNTFLIVLSAQNDNTVVQFLVSANGKSVKVRTKWWRDGWSEWNLIGS